MSESINLMQALKWGRIDTARELIANGDNSVKGFRKDELGSVYGAILRNKAFEFIPLFIDQGMLETDLYEYDSFKNTFFESLVRQLPADEASQSFLSDFLSKVQSLNSELEDQTLLGYALNEGADISIIRAIVDAGGDLNYKNNAEQNFIHQVVSNNAMFVRNGDKVLAQLQYLLDQGLDVDAGDIVKTTPLMVAVRNNRAEAIALLLKNGANPNEKDQKGHSAFYKAIAELRSLDLYDKMMEYETPEFDAVTAEGQTLLTEFLRSLNSPSEKELQLLQKMVTDGADLRQTAPYYDKQKSALDWAAEKPVDILKTILDAGDVDLDAVDEQGNTLLHKVCAFNPNYDANVAKETYRKAKLLIERGADTTLVNDKDETAFMLASDDNLKAKTAELLLLNKA